MMQDLLLDENGDLAFPLQRGESTKQHQELLLVIDKGGIKENPTATVGVMNYLESEDTAGLLQEIRKCFTADGMNVTKCGLKNGKIEIDASYTS